MLATCGHDVNLSFQWKIRHSHSKENEQAGCGASIVHILQCVLLSCYFLYLCFHPSQTLVGLCLGHKNFTVKLRWIDYSLISWCSFSLHHSHLAFFDYIKYIGSSPRSNPILQKYCYSVRFLLLPRWKVPVFQHPILLMTILLALKWHMARQSCFRNMLNQS